MTPQPEYGVDLITFYHPSFWGVSTYDEIMELRQREPETIWAKIFDALQAAGITAIEMTFPPADMSSAIDVFGSASGFKAELDARGLTLKSGFHMGTGWAPGVDVGAEVARAVDYAQFLADSGGDVLVVGPPMRQPPGSTPRTLVDLEFATAFSATAHAVGSATLDLGVKMALHTEANSTFCSRRDVDFLLGVTDPEVVFFCPDTAHLTLAGGDPIAIVQDHLDRVVIAHFKDAVGAMPKNISYDLDSVHDEHRKYMCTLGSGVVDWVAWLELYGRSEARSLNLLELDAVEDPVTEMIAGKAFIENLHARA